MTQKQFDALMIEINAKQSEEIAQYDNIINSCNQEINVIELAINEKKREIIQLNIKKRNAGIKRQEAMNRYHQKKHKLCTENPKDSMEDDSDNFKV